MNESPPRWATLLLEFFCSDEHREIIKGDLEEFYRERSGKVPRPLNNLYYFVDVLKCLRPGLLIKQRKRYTLGSSNMILKNYLKLTRRNFVRNRSFSILNLAGLSFAMLVFLIIVSYLYSELSYDRHHKNSDRVYRLVLDLTSRGEEKPWAIITGNFADLAKQEINQVEEFARLIPSWGNKNLIRYQDEMFYETKFGWADPSILKVFDFEFLAGNTSNALAEPYTIIISESMAKKLFGNENPLGKIINRDNTSDYAVTGVFKDIPTTSHFTFDYIASLNSASDDERSGFWGYSYILVKNSGRLAQLNEDLKELYLRHKKEGTTGNIWAQPLHDIHLRSNLMYEFQPNGNFNTILIFAITSLLILFLASVNFVNLSIAMGIRRIKEVGIRKILGARKSQITAQFLFESILITIIGFIVAYLATPLVIDEIQSFTGQSIEFEFGSPIWLPLTLLGIAIAIGLIAGIYPAIFLAAFQPVKIFSGGNSGKSDGSAVRKFLVGFQFAISILLIVSVFIVQKQVYYLKHKELGINTKQALVIPLQYATDLQNHRNSFKNDLLTYTGISTVSFMGNLPGELIQMPVGTVTTPGSGNPDSVRVKYFVSDHDFIQTLGITLKSGRDFNPSILTDTVDAVIINEKAAKSLGFEVAVGQKIHLGGSWDKEFTIIGVIEDFHFASLHHLIEPLLIIAKPGNYNKVVINLETINIDKTIEFLETVWKKYEPDRPLEYFFLDNYFNQKYLREQATLNMILLFTISGILIACLGLYGLATFVLHLRLKEVGIRKILGASMNHLLGLLIKEFVVLILIAAVIATPIAYFLMNEWLKDFAYRISVDYQIFVGSLMIVLGCALLTIGRIGFIVAGSNPVETLKKE